MIKYERVSLSEIYGYRMREIFETPQSYRMYIGPEANEEYKVPSIGGIVFRPREITVKDEGEYETA